MPGKRIHFDDKTLHTAKLLARGQIQGLVDEAFRDLLLKYGPPPS